MSKKAGLQCCRDFCKPRLAFPAIIFLLFLGKATFTFGQDLVPDPEFAANVFGSTFDTEFLELPDGKLLIWGDFEALNGVKRTRIGRLNADGTLDTSFDPAATIEFNSGNNSIYDVVVQDDGKIVITGPFTSINGIAQRDMARLNADGTLDTTFSIPAGSGTFRPKVLAIQNDGKILAAGDFGATFDGVLYSDIVRFNADGSLDTSFASPSELDGFAGNSIHLMALQPDGKILLGAFNYEIFQDKYVIRLNADGSYDATFNEPSFGYALLYSMVVRPDGKILLGGDLPTTGGDSRYLLQLNSDGSIDYSFQSGHVSIDEYGYSSLSGPSGTVRSIHLLSDGSIYIGGNFFQISVTSRARLAKLASDGSLDTSWLPQTPNQEVRFVKALSNGEVIVAGSFWAIGTNPAGGLAKFSSNGSLQSAFPAVSQRFVAVGAVARTASGHIAVGGGFSSAGAVPRAGLAIFDASGEPTSFAAPPPFSTGISTILAEPDGGLLIGGAFSSIGARSRFARLNPDGTVDTSFPSVSFYVYDSARQDDEKVIIVGAFSSVGGTVRERVARLNADGTLDAGFVPPAINGNVHALLIQPDGKMLIGGAFTTVGGVTRNRLARLNEDGTHDTTFDAGIGPNNTVYALALDDGGNILAGGNFSTFNGSSSHKYLVRMSSNGSLDTAFTAPLNNSVFSVKKIAGKTLVGGAFTEVSGTSRQGFARLNADGTLDGSLVSSIPNGRVNVIYVGDDGSVLLGGAFSEVDGVMHAGIVRLDVFAPLITSQSTSRSVTSGDSVTFTVDASGAEPLTYQWSKDGTPIAGETSASLTINPVGYGDEGTYTVTVTNSFGSATSNGATLTVNAPPSPPFITSQPSSQAIQRNQSVTLSVSASGSGTIAYQWFQGTSGDTSTPVGTNSSSYTTPTLASTTSYWVSVVNFVGSTNSSTATITVGDPPTIATQPVSLSVNVGSSATFNVTAAGSPPFQYQWKKGGSNIPGATGASYQISAADESSVGTFSVVVTNSFGSITSDSATLSLTYPPTIATPISSQSVTEGATVTFTVQATGDSPLTYVWRRNGTVLTGESGSSLIIADVSPNDTGTYQVTVSNASGTASSTASLSVNTPASISIQPSDRTITTGQSTTLSVSGAGTGPLSYAWYQGLAGDSSMPVGSNAATFTTPALTQDAAYHVVVSNAYGSATSRTATVRVGSVPSITTQPTAITVTAGESVEFSVNATGTGPLAYQWRKDGTTLAGETGAVLNLGNASAAMAGSYDVIVSNDFGSTTSNPATLTVNSPPQITVPPQSQTVLAGDPVTFSVTATGTGQLSYQWSRNFEPIPGGTTSTLSLAAVSDADQGDYRVLVTNAYGSATGGPAILTVNSPPKITSNPQAQNIASGNAAQLSVTATGQGTLSYQWYRGSSGDTSQPESGGSASFQTPILTQTTSYWVRVSNAFGFVNSLTATLTVGQPPVISTEPVSQTVTAGTDVQFSVVATGDAPLSYQWRKNGVNIDGSGPTLTLTDVSFSSVGTYDVVISNAFGSVTSVGAELSVESPPVITSEPDSISVAEGGTAIFSVTATGDAPLTYQWKKDGANLPGQTSFSLTISPVSPSDAATYSVVVTNSSGFVESPGAILTVQSPPSITSGPASTQVTTGSPVTLSVTATGSTPLDYQWYQGNPGDTSNPVGVNSPTLSLSSLTETTTFWVRVSNTYGSVDSTAGVVTVGSAPSISLQPASITVNAGETTTLSVTATGSGTLQYQWKRNGSDLDGETESTLLLYQVSAGSAGNYTVTVSNSFGSIASATATVSVRTPPSIIDQPDSAVVSAGTTVTFSVSATGSAPLSYQWLKDEEEITGQTNSTLIIGSVGLADEGIYSVRVTNPAGSATSDGATLQVNAPPAIAASPSSATILYGQTATLHVAATGSGPLVYQWYRGATGETAAPVGIDSLSYTTEPLTASTSYWVRVSNALGTADSEAATITVDDPTPSITSPATATAQSGSLFSYRILATADPTAFDASGLPDGLLIDPLTGVISGVPTEGGEFEIELSASTPRKTGTKTLVLTVTPPVPVITSSTTASGIVGQAFEYQIVATGNPDNYTANNLPGFLTVNATGLVSGTPNTAGTYSIQVRAANSAGISLRTVTVIILSTEKPPSMTGATAVTGTVNTFLTHQLTALNEPTAFSASGLPGGLSLNPATGIISGAPSTAGTFTATVTASNANGTSGQFALTFAIAPAPAAPVVQPVVLPRIHMGDSISIPVSATNSPTVFSATGLPPGLTQNPSTGQISGIPTVSGTFPVTLFAGNAGGTSEAYQLDFLIRTPRQTPVMQNSARTGGRLTVPFSLALTASNGPLEFRASNLPAGLLLNSSSGVISGTPTDTGTFTVAVAARNDDGWGADLVMVFSIIGAPTAPVIQPDVSVTARIGEPFQFRIQATESPTAYTANGLPPGLSIDTEIGLIGGTPTEVGIFDVTLTAENAIGMSAPEILRITVQAPLGAPVITSAGTVRGKLEQAFYYKITASNQPTAFRADDLPPGLSLNGDTITGIPTNAGIFEVTLAASNPSRGFGTPSILVVTIDGGTIRPRITSPASASGAQGQPFSYLITAVNGPIQGFLAENLPNGLSLDATTGLISGTLLDAGIQTFRVNASNANGEGLPLTVHLTAAHHPAAPVVYSTTYVSGYAGDPFSYQIKATNSPDEYRATDLPSWLSLNPGTGKISASTLKAGVHTFKVSAGNSAGWGPDHEVTLNVATLAAQYRTDGPVSVQGYVNEVLYIKPTRSGASGSGYVDAYVSNPSWWDYYYNWDHPNQRWQTRPVRTGTTYFYNRFSSESTYGTWRAITVNVLSRQPTMKVTSPTLVYVRAGEPFTYQLSAAGSPASYSFRFVGETPGGIEIDNVTGLVSGVPSRPGTYAALASAFSALPEEGPSQEITLVVNPAIGTASITGATDNDALQPKSLSYETFSSFSVWSQSDGAEAEAPITASGQVGQPFTYTLQASADVTAFEAEDLPPGLALNPSTGEISGVPQLPGSYEVTVRAWNDAGPGGDATLIITIAAAPGTPVVSSILSASATVGIPFNYTITATESPLGFNAADLPPWAVLDDATGSITGTPDISGIHDALISANNASGIGASATLVLTVGAAAGTPQITSSATASGSEGAPFEFQLTATGEPDTFSADTLPPGLLLDIETGLISGTPGGKGVYPILVHADNANGPGDEFELVITINPASGTPVLTNAETAEGRVGEAFSYQLSASASPISFTSTELPAGLVLDPGTGEISGIPTTEGETTLTLRATNSLGTGPTKSLTLLIGPARETFPEWASRLGLPAGEDGPNDVPFADGIPNAVRFALGISDFASARERLPAFEIRNETAGSLPSLLFTRSTEAGGVIYTLEGGAGVSALTSVPYQLEVIGPVDATSERIRIQQTLPINGEDSWFLRLKVDFND